MANYFLKQPITITELNCIHLMELMQEEEFLQLMVKAPYSP